MTGAYRRVRLTELPNLAATHLKRFLFAYLLNDSGRFVIRHADPSDNSIEELEFDPRSGRFLAAHERLRLRASEPRRFRMPSGETVQETYRVHQGRSTLLAHYDVFANDTSKKVLEAEQEVYAPMASEPIAFVAKALERSRFPFEYAAWHDHEKASYWADTLHGLRRAKGESGRDEDEVFTPALLRDMERTDPTVRVLAPRIMRRLAALEQDNPRQLETPLLAASRASGSSMTGQFVERAERQRGSLLGLAWGDVLG